jgi:hypothetical protein
MKLSHVIIIGVGLLASAGVAQQLLKTPLPETVAMPNSASLEENLKRVQAVIDQAKQSPTTSTADAKKQMHKCVNAQSTIYTDEACPKGMKEQAIKNGTYNVISSVKVDAPKKETQASTMHDKALQQQLGDGY